jgi:hypothetical protein
MRGKLSVLRLFRCFQHCRFETHTLVTFGQRFVCCGKHVTSSGKGLISKFYSS